MTERLPRLLFALVACSLMGGLTSLLSQPACANVGEPDYVLGPEAAPDSGAALTGIAPSEHDLVWDRIRAGISQPLIESPYTAQHEEWFSRNPQYMQRMVERARLYLHYIVEEVEKRGMPMEIALLPAIESAYQPDAKSSARAVGLWQFIHSTGKLYGLKLSWWYDGRRDVAASTQAALDYLEKLRDDFSGDWQLALAAYNCGEGRVARAVEMNRRKGLPTDYQSLRLPNETDNYVPKLQAMVNIILDPGKYGLVLAEIPNKPYFDSVEINDQVDLSVMAKIMDMPATELYRINPGYSRWVTEPHRSNTLLVPADKKDAVIEGLNALPEAERVDWVRDRVRLGDTLQKMARRHNVTADAIRLANRIDEGDLPVGRHLIIPVSAARVAALGTLGMHVEKEPPRVRKQRGGAIVKLVHRVRSGETLFSIAKRYRVQVGQIRKWNAMHRNEPVQRGQRLYVWAKGKGHVRAGTRRTRG